jgi:hypothetical protein
MNLLDAMKDIIKHTGSLGFFEMIKIMGTNTTAKLETKDADNTVIMYGEMYQPIKGIDSTIGLSRLAILKGYIGIHESSDVSIVAEQRGNTTVPTEIVFDNKDGLTANYRFMSEAMINDQVKVPPFKGATWDVNITPEKKAINLLNDNFGVLGSYEKRCIVSVHKGTLNFSIGAGPTDRVNVPFAKNVTGTLKHQWSYPLTQLLSILKLSDTASSCTMSISDMGALKIDIDSGIGKYSYILPAARA